MRELLRTSSRSTTARAALASLAGLALAVSALAPLPALAEPAAVKAAMDVFSKVCLASAPNFDHALASFRAHGYAGKTKDPLILAAKNGAGFAGIGIVQSQDQTKVTKPNGCLVYVKGDTAKAMVPATEAALKAHGDKFTKVPYGKDTYWALQIAGKPMLVSVSPKSAGAYAGYTLLMMAPYQAPSMN